MKLTEKVLREEFDSPWKKIITTYFREFMEFFFPKAAKEIDWSKKYTSLDKEFAKIARGAETTGMLADKLMQVWRNNGDVTWVTVHIEVQAQRQANFAKRIYRYNYRIYDMYNRPVASFAVLADENPEWRPSDFKKELWGCETHFSFPSAKLLDYRFRIDELEKSDNIFALVTAAHLRTLETKKNFDDRMTKKFGMIKNLYRLDLSRQDILNLYAFIEWIMVLPEELDRKLYGQIKKYEEEHKMEYVSIAERVGMERGMEHGMERGMERGMEHGMKRGMERGMERGLERGIKKGEINGKINGEITAWQAVLQNPKIHEDLADQARTRLAELKSCLADG